MASNQNKFVLSDLPITVNLSKCKKTLCFLYKSKKAPHGSVIAQGCGQTLGLGLVDRNRTVVYY